MKTHQNFYLVSFLMILSILNLNALSQTLDCEFTVAARVCVLQEVPVTYVGNATASAVYVWNFDGGEVLSGSGQGPYIVQWAVPGEKHLSLSIEWEGMNCTFYRAVVVVHLPLVFHMTGGGTYIAGGDGVMVGLSGSEPGIIYKLCRNGTYTGIHVVGNGNEISFGYQTEPGTYTCKAKVDGSDCTRDMEGTAVVTITAGIPESRLCMVSYDTSTNNNILIWNRQESGHILQYNLYRESYQNNVYTKIGEVPYSDPCLFIDSTANPLVKSDRYKISITDLSGTEHEKSAAHKTIHLNINPGINCYNLIWNYYEGFEYLYSRIHRKIGDGPYEPIDSIPYNVNSYTDFGVESGLATYYIEVIRPEPCHPYGKNGQFASVISNIASAVPYGIDETKSDNLTLYPNPVKNDLNIVVKGPDQEDIILSICETSGKICARQTIKNGRTHLDMSSFAAGIYIVSVMSNEGVIFRKMVKE